MKNNEVYMVDYVRTPFSRARPRTPERDALSDVTGVRLVAETLNNLMDIRVNEKVSRDDIDHFILGCAQPYGDSVPISGKLPLFMARFPVTTPSFVTERQCGSGMTALHQAHMSITLGYDDTVIVSGYEHQTRVPMHNNKNVAPDIAVANPMSRWFNPDIDMYGSIFMVQTAQKLFEMNMDYFSKEDMDRYGVKSHNLAEKALDEGYFSEEIVPILGHKEGDDNIDFEVKHDLSIRRGATLEDMAKLRPVSKPGWIGGFQDPEYGRDEYTHKNNGSPLGSITAGNASPMNAGAATMLMMSKQKMEEKGLEPMARIVDIGYAGVDPTVMGRGPVPASQNALKNAGLTVEDIDYWEINEAFAIVALNGIRELGIKDHEAKVNIKGGATAIGHPLSATGIRMPGTLARILKEKKARYGLATMCVGVGQGTTVIIENMDA